VRRAALRESVVDAVGSDTNSSQYREAAAGAPDFSEATMESIPCRASERTQV
jgi:hypothetical protein